MESPRWHLSTLEPAKSCRNVEIVMLELRRVHTHPCLLVGWGDVPSKAGNVAGEDVSSSKGVTLIRRRRVWWRSRVLHRAFTAARRGNDAGVCWCQLQTRESDGEAGVSASRGLKRERGRGDKSCQVEERRCKDSACCPVPFFLFSFLYSVTMCPHAHEQNKTDLFFFFCF